jgi:uncharacterized protein (DUF362 family)
MLTRRELIGNAAAGAAVLATPRVMRAEAPASKVAVARCESYGQELLPTMKTMFDQLGGLGPLVKGKTVAIKINLTGGAGLRLGYAPAELSHYTHPAVIATTVRLLSDLGARRVRLLEGCYGSAEPIGEFIMAAGWNPSDLLNAAARVEMENTNVRGPAKGYVRVKPPNNGYMYPAYDLNHSYDECDVFVSIAKMKEHATAGVTLSMKNLFGIAPISIYGDAAGEDEPNELPRGGRGMFHSGRRQPSKSAPGEHPGSPKAAGQRVPRIVADLTAARPVHLAIVDGIITQNRGEGPWIAGSVMVKPGLLLAGLNPVCTDAVGTALMGFDPMADHGTAPFERCDSTLKLAENHGVGTRDLRRIEVVGLPIQGNVFNFRERRRV